MFNYSFTQQHLYICMNVDHKLHLAELKIIVTLVEIKS